MNRKKHMSRAFTIVILVCLCGFIGHKVYQFFASLTDNNIQKNRIIQQYTNEFDKYNDIREVLMKCTDNVRIEATSSPWARGDWYYFRINDDDNYYLIDVSGEEISDALKEYIAGSMVVSALDKIGIKQVSRVGNRIFFYNYSTIGFAAGVAYCSDKESNEPDGKQYIIEWEEIAPNWYYFEQE